jgi:hypothetical protein
MKAMTDVPAVHGRTPEDKPLIGRSLPQRRDLPEGVEIHDAQGEQVPDRAIPHGFTDTLHGILD